MSSQLVWECIKGHNSKLRKAAKGIVFSAEAGNLYNKHSYKYSGRLTNEADIPCSLQAGTRVPAAFSCMLVAALLGGDSAYHWRK